MAAARAIEDEDVVRVAGVAISHPDRGLYPGLDLTKRDLARYYEKVAPRMLPHAGGRLLSLVRCPQGQGEPCFFQKHPGRGLPDGIRIAEIEEKTGEDAHYLFVSDARGLIGLVQIGTLEVHVWGSSIPDIDRPDRLAMDIDPDEGLPFAEVRRAAVELRDRLDELGLRSFALATGGKGVHVVAPLARRRGWADVKAFARGLAAEMVARDADRYVDVASKRRRRGKIFVDYLRNDRGSTAIAPYSTRAKPGAPVATPVTWDELASLTCSNVFGLDDVVRRVGKADPWAGYGGLRQSLTKRALAAVGAT